MQELKLERRCLNAHPDFPKETCGAIIKARSTGGLVHIECWRCYKPVFFDFEQSGTEAVDKEPVHV